VVFYASAQTIVQLDSPDHLRGRIMGIWMIVFSGSVSLGALWTGKAATLWGVDVVMASSALLCAVVGILVMALGVLSPHNRAARSMVEGANDRDRFDARPPR
jgi:sugar (pentulose or hexulose) kinase